MNQKSEQLRFDTSIELDMDQPLSLQKIFDAICKWLEEDKVKLETICDKKVITFQLENKKIVLLCKAITYLGNPHPIYKKRIQLPQWYQEFYMETIKTNPSLDVRFLGVYHYEGNIVFVDFLKDTYLQHGLHNSSAHVYINDLYEGMTYGIFEKTDKFGNKLVVIRNDRLIDYLKGIRKPTELPLFEIFKKFNCGFTFGKWLLALDVIKEMHADKWHQWRQAEWAGWFLEYRFHKFIHENHLEKTIKYTGVSNKKSNEPDFDLHFIEQNFYGDLKASDINKHEAPGNDQRNLIDCIYRYKRFWYIIYEHETIKDSKETGFSATIGRNRYIKLVDPKYSKDEMSYSSKMKNSVRFTKMTILELNAINFRNILKDFNQGHQPDGSPRAPKFNIDKKTLDNDNYVVFRYSYQSSSC